MAGTGFLPVALTGDAEPLSIELDGSSPGKAELSAAFHRALKSGLFTHACQTGADMGALTKTTACFERQ